MTRSVDVLIVGAGIVGAACAFELTKAGLQVTVVDERFTSGGATGASMGHIVVMDDSEAQFSLTRYSQLLWEELHEELPPEIEFERCGTIWVAVDEEEMADVRRKCAYYRARGVQAEILDPQALHQAEPYLRKLLAGGLLVEGDSVIYPPAAASFLLERAVELGASLHTSKAVISLGKGNARLSDGTTLSAGRLINAAGQFSPKLTPSIQVKPRKGHLVITDRYPGAVRHQLVELGYLKSTHSLTSDSVAFNIQPRKTGQLLIGSSRQYDIEHDQVDSAILSRMLQRAFEYLPRLASYSGIRVWTGFRPATPDKLPLIGPWPADPTLYIATGHEGLGITTSLATGKLICALILGQAPAIPPEPYLPSRQVVPETKVETHV
jgi:glycine/D-amino acid oxidase-like deaminating enzyme